MRGFHAEKFIVLSTLLLAGCQTTQQAVHNTPSQKPEVTIAGSADQIKPRMVNHLLNKGWVVIKETPYQLTVEQPITNLAFNIVYGTEARPQAHVRTTFTINEMNGQTRVVGDFGIVSNSGTAFEKITPMNQDDSTIEMQNWLNTLKGEIEATT